tara:strand:- start:15 stop:380 length:366 start_codon:yes stop_codon:yes gene_type:complete
MAHYAKIVYGKVTTVIVAEAEFFDTFVDDSPGTWVQTSYNTNEGKHKFGKTPLRKNFAGIGMNYDGIGFYEDSPYPSWIFNPITYTWNPPISKPLDGKYYEWNESTKSWDETVADWPKEDK